MRGAVFVVSVAGCGFSTQLPATDAVVTTDGAVDIATLGPWSAPTLVALPPPTMTDDDPSPTADLLELYINSSRNGNADVFVATRATTSASWSTPTAVALVSSLANETTPEVSYDGLAIVIASDRAGTSGGNDLWLSTRASRAAPWGMPVRIAALSSTSSEAGGNITPDGLAVVFSSFRTGNGSPDLFIAERAMASGTWGDPVEVAAVNTNAHEGSPFLSADKLTLYFDTDRGGNLDLYMSQRASTTEPFSSPTQISELTTTDDEQDPWVSADGRRLLFSSKNQLWESTR